MKLNLDDASLIERARGGSAVALSALYRRYWPLTWQWAYAITGDRTRADDLAQEAMLRALKSLRGFDVERPLTPWLKRIVLNVAADELHRLSRRPLAPGWMHDRHAPADEDAARASSELVEAVRTLPPARRLVIVLHYWLDLPVDEVAALLGLPYGTVASRLSRGLAELRAALKEEHV